MNKKVEYIIEFGEDGFEIGRTRVKGEVAEELAGFVVDGKADFYKKVEGKAVEATMDEFQSIHEARVKALEELSAARGKEVEKLAAERKAEKEAAAAESAVEAEDASVES